MKNTVLLLLLLSFVSCENLEDVETVAFSDEKSILYDPLPQMVEKAMYVNNLLGEDEDTGIAYLDVLGDRDKQLEMISWLQDNNFNTVYLYKIGEITKNYDHVKKLSKLVRKFKNNGFKVVFVSSGHGASFDRIINYVNRYQEKKGKLPDGIISEIEYWNAIADYETDFVPWMSSAQELKNTLNTLGVDFERKCYISHLDLDGVDAENITIAKTLIANHETIVLVNYHKKAYEIKLDSESANSMINKLQILARASEEYAEEYSELNPESSIANVMEATVARIVILFNVKEGATNSMYNYVSVTHDNHTFEALINSFVDSFLQTDIILQKDRLKIHGYAFYRYTDANQARP